MATPQRGDFVRVRTRRWLVEDVRGVGDGLTVRLACIDDDAQGETVELLWDAELDGTILSDEGWAAVAKMGTDDPAFSQPISALCGGIPRRPPTAICSRLRSGRHPPGCLSAPASAQGAFRKWLSIWA